MTDAIPVTGRSKRAKAEPEVAPTVGAEVAPTVEAEVAPTVEQFDPEADYTGRDHPIHGKWNGSGWTSVAVEI